MLCSQGSVVSRHVLQFLVSLVGFHNSLKSLKERTCSVAHVLFIQFKSKGNACLRVRRVNAQRGETQWSDEKVKHHRTSVTVP